MASKDEDDDDGFDNDDNDKDEDASSSGDDEMTASQWLTLCHSWQKGEVVLGIRAVIYLGRELVLDIFVKKGDFFVFLRDAVRTFVSFIFFNF